MPSASVAAALAAVPISFGLRDVRPDPYFVGIHEQKQFVVRTRDNVGHFCGNRIGEMLLSAGARMNEQPIVALEADLVEYRVDEGQRFRGLVRFRMTLRRQGYVDWSKVYEGKSTRWGATHNPENFNAALSGSLAEAMKSLLYDEEFARILSAPPPPASPPPPRGS